MILFSKEIITESSNLVPPAMATSILSLVLSILSGLQLIFLRIKIKKYDNNLIKKNTINMHESNENHFGKKFTMKKNIYYLPDENKLVKCIRKKKDCFFFFASFTYNFILFSLFLLKKSKTSAREENVNGLG